MELLGGFSYAGSYIKQGTRDTPGMVARIVSTKFCFPFPYPPPLFPCLSFPFPKLPLLSYLAPAHLHPIPNPPPHLPSFLTSRISRTWIWTLALPISPLIASWIFRSHFHGARRYGGIGILRPEFFSHQSFSKEILAIPYGKWYPMFCLRGTAHWATTSEPVEGILWHLEPASETYSFMTLEELSWSDGCPYILYIFVLHARGHSFSRVRSAPLSITISKHWMQNTHNYRENNWPLRSPLWGLWRYVVSKILAWYSKRVTRSLSEGHYHMRVQKDIRKRCPLLRTNKCQESELNRL